MASPNNWTAAFISYAEGASCEEVAKIHGIPLNKVRRKAYKDRWTALRQKSVALSLKRKDDSLLPAKVEEKLALIEANRFENLKQAQTMREHLAAQLQKLVSGELMVERQGKNGVVLRFQPGPQEWVQIATYAKLVQDLTYRALGDAQAAGQGKSDAPAGPGGGQAPAITVILPGVIAAPRAERQAKTGPVIDLRPADVSRECQEQPALAQVEEPKPLSTNEPAADSSGL